MGTIQSKDFTQGLDLDDNDTFYTERSGVELKKSWYTIRTLLGGSSGGSGVFSYIDSATFESGLTGWSTYADAAGSTPVDGTGGTPTSPQPTINTTNVLHQTKDLTWAKPASNVQGEGISVNFSLPRASLGREQFVAFPYLVDVDSVLGVYIYDVTNSVLIPTSMVNLNKSYNSIPNFFFAKWIPTSSTSYRFIIHVQTNTASAVNLEIDDVVINVYSPIVSAAIEMEKSYTPTFTGFGTPTSINFTYARRGNKIIVMGRFTTGTVTATEARISLPNNYLSDSTLISTLQVCGNCVRSSSSANSQYVLIEPGVGYVTFGQQGGASAGTTKQNASAIFGSSEVLTIMFEIPIAGLGVNANVGGDFTEYAYNSQATINTNDTSSFVNGASAIVGTGILSNTAQFTYYDCKFLRKIQANDEVKIEFRHKTTGIWLDTARISYLLNGATYPIGLSMNSYPSASGTTPGVGYNVVSSDTVRVFFGNVAGSVAGVGNETWATLAADATYGFDRWRVKKVSGGNVSEYGIYYDSIELDSPNGHGATNNKIRRWSNSVIVGTSMTYADSAANGMTVTINESGLYSIIYGDFYSVAPAQLGVSLNSNQLTTIIASITTANRLTVSNSASGAMGFCSWIGRLSAGDVVRAHTDGTPNSTSADRFFKIKRIGR